MTQKVLLAGFLLLLPVQFGFLPFNLQVADVLFILLLLSTVLERRRWNLGWAPADVLLVAYLSASALSVAFAPSRAGRLALIKEAYCAVIYICFAVLAAQGGAPAVARWSAMASTVVCAVALPAAALFAFTGTEVRTLGQAMPLPYIGQVFRLTGFFETPEMFVNYLAFSLPLSLALALRSSESGGAWWKAGAFMAGVSALLTFARGLPGLAAGALFYLWPRLGEGRAKGLRGAFFLATATAFLCVNLALGFAIRRVMVSGDMDRTASAPAFPYAFQGVDGGSPRVTVAVTYEPMSYLRLKRTAVQALRSSPLFGIGLGRFQEATERDFQAGRLHERHRAMRPHSTWFGRLAETGIFGGLTLAALWVGILHLGLGRSRAPSQGTWLARALLAGILAAFANSPNADVMNFRFLWVAFGILRGLPPRKEDMERA